MSRKAAPAQVRDGSPDSPPRDGSVFINCPFDADYQASFDTIVFTVICCGLHPRSALDSNNTATPRMRRITESLRDSRFSIHDLSRCRGEQDDNLARFNMPFELGIAMAMKQAADDGESRRVHDWTVLVPEGLEYQRAISDLNGYDLQRYHGRENLIAEVMLWLLPRLGESEVAFTPADVAQALPRFDEALSRLRGAWMQRQPWRGILAAGRQIAQDARLQPVREPATS